jgi:hypothetical protein
MPATQPPMPTSLATIRNRRRDRREKLRERLRAEFPGHF